jgi:organic hydroperoxide reductase OsmC/OhrA
MHPYPHHYTVSAVASPAGSVAVSATGLPDIATAPPPEFDGPGDQWSPESLLCAAVADCFLLSFRSYARAARFEWQQLACQVEGTLERVAGVSSFTSFTTRATLRITADADEARARVLMEQAEHGCLIANSLRGSRTLVAQVLRDEQRRIA